MNRWAGWCSAHPGEKGWPDGEYFLAYRIVGLPDGPYLPFLSGWVGGNSWPLKSIEHENTLSCHIILGPDRNQDGAITIT